MKIAIPSDSQQSIGGGWTFRRNLIKGLAGRAEVVDNAQEADIILIAGPTMILRETFETAKALGQKIVVRLDNVPRNSRNRNTGTSRLKEFAQGADALVYQSEWSKFYLEDFVDRTDGVIINNGVDTTIFNTQGARYDFQGDPVYIFSQYNRDETKRWDEAWYKFQLIYRSNPEAKLVLVGNFSPELQEYNFDFFRGEKIEYMGVIGDPNEMAKILRGCNYFLATYFNDCYANTYNEALACGVELFEPNMSGGTPEILKNGPISLERMASDYLELFEKLLK